MDGGCEINKHISINCRLARDQGGYNFDFRIKYKMLSKESAVVRFGGIKYQGE